jgi:succinate dehydrogenase hydrophobic anchor subunit
VVSNPAPKAKASGSSGDRSAVSEWLSVRSNQVLLAVLIIAFVLFAFVMLGGGA